MQRHSCLPAELFAGQAGIDTLALRLASGEVHVLVVNRRVADARDVGGEGIASDIEVKVAGLDTPRLISAWHIDSRTPLLTGPVAEPLGTGNIAAFRAPGYSVTLLEFR